MARAGFDSVFIGIESPDEGQSDGMPKGSEKKRKKPLQDAGDPACGLQVLAVSFCFDSDHSVNFPAAYRFSFRKAGLVTAMVAILQKAPPGTRLFERLKKQNRVVGPISGDNVDEPPTSSQVALTAYRGYQAIMAHIILPSTITNV